MNVRTGAPMAPMGGMPMGVMNPLPPPMPVPPMGQQMMPPQAMPMQQGAVPVAPQVRSNAGRRKRFGDSLETMLASNVRPAGPVASDQMAGMNVFTGQMPRRPMPRGQMMGGTAMQPPVRRMMGGGSVPVPRETDIYGQPHMLAYINPEEADLLQGLGGMGTPGPGGVPQYNWFTDFVASITGGDKSSNTGGRNSPRGSSSNTTSTSTSNANQAYADSMKAGGGGTNLSGSGSSAMADLVAAQQAQTQKDDNRPSYFEDITPPSSGTGGYDEIPLPPDRPSPPPPPPPTPPSPPTYGIPGNTEGDPFDRPPNTGVVGGYDPIGGGSVDDVGIGTGSGVIGGYDPIGGGSVDDVGIGAPIYPGDDDNNTSPNDPEPIIPTPGTGGGDTDTDTGVNLEPPVEEVYYDMFGNAYKTFAEARAADAEHLRKQQEAEQQRLTDLANEEEARIQALIASQEAEQAKRLREETARALQDPREDESNVMTNYLPPDLTDPRGDEANVMTNYLIADPINTGLNDPSLDKKVTKTGTGEEEEKKGFIDQFKDDAKEFGNSFVNDIQMGIAAGLFGSRATRFQRLIDAGYTKEQANSFLDRSEQTMKDMMKKQAQQSAQDDDGGSAPIIDPCPEGMRLDPVAGICVPVEDTSDDDTEEDDTDEKEDTSDDELSGVVTTPPPPTSYLDNPIRMNRGGSVGLNRAADNFLAAMGG